MTKTSASFDVHVVTGKFATPFSNVELFVWDLGTFVSTKLDKIPAENSVRLHVLQLVGLLLLSLALQLMSITVKRNNASEKASVNDQFPSVMPHELVKYRRSPFCATVRKHIL